MHRPRFRHQLPLLRPEEESASPLTDAGRPTSEAREWARLEARALRLHDGSLTPAQLALARIYGFPV